MRRVPSTKTIPVLIAWAVAALATVPACARQGVQQIAPTEATATDQGAEAQRAIDTLDPPRRKLFNDDKLLMTNGVATVEGSAGGGLSSWAVIPGMETNQGIGLSAFATGLSLRDFTLEAHGLAIGIKDRLALSYARENFNTLSAGTALGLGHGYTFRQDIFGMRLRLFGDSVYGRVDKRQSARECRRYAHVTAQSSTGALCPPARETFTKSESFRCAAGRWAYPTPLQSACRYSG